MRTEPLYRPSSSRMANTAAGARSANRSLLSEEYQQRPLRLAQGQCRPRARPARQHCTMPPRQAVPRSVDPSPIDRQRHACRGDADLGPKFSEHGPQSVDSCSCVASATSGQMASANMRDFDLLRASRRWSEVNGHDTKTSTIYGRAETADSTRGGAARRNAERGVPDAYSRYIVHHKSSSASTVKRWR